MSTPEIIHHLDKNTFLNPLEYSRFLLKFNYEVPLHSHAFFEVAVVTGGRGKHLIGDSSISVTLGDVFIIPPGVNHGFEESESLNVHHILISSAFMQKNLADLRLLPGFEMLFDIEPNIRANAAKPMYLKLTDEQFCTVQELLTKVREYKNRTDNYVMCIRNAFSLLAISTLCKMYMENTINNPDNAHSCDTTFVKALSIIHERYYEKITISMLTRATHLSRTAFLKKFKDFFGMPPGEYIIKKRLGAAKNMLITTTQSLSDIANKTGFSDASHLSRAFKKEYGISPASFRNKAER